jgi:ribosomal-protein-alanine N-acetyltransferase
MIALFRRLFSRSAPSLGDASPSDAAAIAALHAASFHRGWSEEEVERLLVERNVMTHRAIAGRALAGFIMSRRAADEAEILSVAVSKACRGRGVARDLLQLHLRRLAGNGVRAVFLEVDETNVPAIRLYRRAGFRDVGKRPNYYATPGAKPAAALVLRRDLG